MSSSPPQHFAHKIQWEENKAIHVTIVFSMVRKEDMIY